MALTTTAAVKSYEGIGGSGSDALIDTIVAAVDAAIKQFLGRQIESAAVTAEIHDGNGRDDFIVLTESPATAISSVAISGTALSVSDYELDGANGIVFYRPGGAGYAPWPAGRRNVSVTYTAGYSIVPADLALAATKQAAYEAKLSIVHGGRLGDRSTILQDGGVAQYVVSPWVTGVLDTLERYRRPRCA